MRHSFYILSALVFTLLLCACSEERKSGPGASRPVPVRAVKIASEDVQQTLAVIGHVEPAATVNLASRVNGQLMASYVQAGHYVEEGQQLFRLDQRSFQAAVARAQAVLARDNAQLRRARQDLQRYRALAAKDFLSKQQYEQSQTEVQALEATVQEDQAALEQAQVELSHTSITAPISGRIGEILVDPGNIVKANDMTLVVINTISPTEISFAVPEKYLPELNRRMRAGPVEVKALPEGDRGRPVSGVITVIDNSVNRDTGTIAMRARFENKDERLWPGQFIRVSIVMEAVPNAVVMPFRAVLEGMNGQYVYRIKEDNTVEVKLVKTTLLDTETLQVTEGLTVNDLVVTTGQLNLFPGASVEIIGDVALSTDKSDKASSPAEPGEQQS